MGRHFPDNPLPSDHLRFLHGEGDAQYRYVGLRRMGVEHNATTSAFRKIQKVSVPSLLGWVDELVGEDKVFLTQADFVWGKRGDPNAYRSTGDYLNRISTIFVDLDIYSSGHLKSLPMGEVVEKVLRVCDDNCVPRPLIICSGRGLYADWALSARLDVRSPENQDAWKLVQNRLMGMLREFGADPKVSDITRVLRLVGTHNLKSGTNVSVLYDDGRRYSLDELTARTSSLPAFTPCKVSKVGAEKQVRAKPVRVAGKDPALSAPLATPEALQYLRDLLEADQRIVPRMSPLRLRQYKIFADIAAVVLSRGGIAVGARDEFLFWMLSSRYASGIYVGRELRDLAGKFAGLAQGGLNIWDNGALKSLEARIARQEAEFGEYRYPCQLRGATGFGLIPMFVKREKIAPVVTEAGKRRFKWIHSYTASVGLVLTRLNITEEEQESLSILKGKREIARRRSLKNVGHRKVARNVGIRTRHLRGGATPREISEETGLSVSTVYGILGKSRAPEEVLSNRAQKGDFKRAVLAVYNYKTGITIRQLSIQTGVPTTTAYRWVAEHKRAERQKKLAAQTLRFEAAVASLGQPKAFDPNLQIPHIPVQFPSFSFVPVSNSSSASIRGKGRGEGIQVAEVVKGVGQFFPDAVRTSSAASPKDAPISCIDLVMPTAYDHSFAVVSTAGEDCVHSSKDELAASGAPNAVNTQSCSAVEPDVDPWLESLRSTATSDQDENPFTGLSEDLQALQPHVFDDEPYLDESLAHADNEEVMYAEGEGHPIPGIQGISIGAPVTEECSQSDAEDAGAEETMSLADIKAMMLTSDVRNAWTIADVRVFDRMVNECDLTWNQGKFKAKQLQVKLVGNQQMRMVLAQFYGLAQSIM